MGRFEVRTASRLPSRLCRTGRRPDKRAGLSDGLVWYLFRGAQEGRNASLESRNAFSQAQSAMTPSSLVICSGNRLVGPADPVGTQRLGSGTIDSMLQVALRLCLHRSLPSLTAAPSAAASEAGQRALACWNRQHAHT